MSFIIETFKKCQYAANHIKTVQIVRHNLKILSEMK